VNENLPPAVLTVTSHAPVVHTGLKNQVPVPFRLRDAG